jgi:hypothetical protein
VAIKGEVVKDGEKLKEHGEGFKGQDLIRRTPPDQQRGRGREVPSMPPPHIDKYYLEPGMS